MLVPRLGWLIMRNIAVSLLFCGALALALAPAAGASLDKDKKPQSAPQKPEPQKPSEPPKPEPPRPTPPPPESPRPQPEPPRPTPAPAPPRPQPEPQRPEPPKPEAPKPQPAPQAPAPPKPETPRPLPNPFNPQPSRPEPSKPTPPTPPTPAPPKPEAPKPQPAHPEPNPFKPKSNQPPAPTPQPAKPAPSSPPKDQKPEPTKPVAAPGKPVVTTTGPSLGSGVAPAPKPSGPKIGTVIRLKPNVRDSAASGTEGGSPKKAGTSVFGATRPSFDTVMVHQLTHKPGDAHKYNDSGGLVHLKPVVVPPIPHHMPGVSHHPHHHPPFFSWAGIWEGIRYGFTTIFSGGGSDGFCFGYYVTDPYSEACTPSPWYYYPNLPPYVQDDCIQEAQPAPEPDTNATPAIPPDWKPDLPHAMEDLVAVWQNQDKDALARLLPTDGLVTLHVEGQDSYDLTAKDFADLFADGVMNTQTTSYKIEETKQLAPDRVQICAVHTFQDPWGQTRTIDHKYTLLLEESGYVIREFRSSTYR